MRLNATCTALLLASAIVGLTPISSRAQSRLGFLIDLCGRGNMAACSQANELAIEQRKQRQSSGRSYRNAETGVGEGLSNSTDVSTSIYKRNLGYRYNDWHIR